MVLNRQKRIIAIAAAVAVILMVPLVGMQFSNEVDWGFFDFVFAGTILFGTGLAYELISSRASNKTAYKVACGIGLGACLLLVWINAAVGIIGDGPANMMYGGVLVVGFIGTIIARLRPQGMAFTLFAMAIAQVLVPVIALVLGISDFAPGVLQVFGLNAFFAALFVGSALLFMQASENSKNSSN